jgi:hypothetical protein
MKNALAGLPALDKGTNTESPPFWKTAQQAMGFVAFGTKEEALQCVNSGEADRMAGHITDMKQRGRK